MAANLYFLSNGSAVEMKEQVFQTEDVLQKIIEENPHLLARSWDDHECRLFLVSREMRIMESDDSSNSFSLDHLLVGEDGIPVLVEVKRSTNTQIRREIVGQIMDYASRAASWNVDELRKMFQDNNSEDVTGEFDNDEFWNQVETNLQAEHIRLVFAADMIPDTLRTIIEFLDRNMKDIEVYGVEIRQYQTSDAMLLSSNVVGNSPLDTQKASSSKRAYRSWNMENFKEYLQEHNISETINILETLKEYAGSIGLSYRYGRGAYCPSISMWLGNSYRILEISSHYFKSKDKYVCYIEINVSARAAILGEDWTKDKVRSMLSEMPGKAKAYKEGLMWDAPQSLYIDLCTFLEPNNMDAFKDSLKTLCETIQEKDNVINTRTFDV